MERFGCRVGSHSGVGLGNEPAGWISAHRTQIQGPASGLLWLEVERMDTCVSPLWSELSHELTVKLLPDAWLPNQTLRQGKATKS